MLHDFLMLAVAVTLNWIPRGWLVPSCFVAAYTEVIFNLGMQLVNW